MKILIVYASVEGQTAKIADFAAEYITQAGHDVVLANADDPATIDFQNTDAVVLAAPVHQRMHPKTFEAFIEASKSALAQHRTLLISVSLSAAFPEGLRDAEKYIEELKTRTGFEPDAELMIAGAVRITQYDYFAMQLIQHVVLRDRDYDVSAGEQEFTDWKALKAGVFEFVGGL